MKSLDWNATKSRARKMSDAALHYAYQDALDTARIWDRTPDQDADGNGPFYHDEASVYAVEIKARRDA